MNVSTGYVYLKNIFVKAEGKAKKVKPSDLTEDIAKNIKGSEIMSEQKRIMLIKNDKNFVESLKKEFKSTKEMFAYAKERCIDGIKKGYEHTVIMDTKTNKVIAEFKGDAKSCKIDCIDLMKLDKENTAVMHGHPKNFPLSHGDICFLKNYGFKQMIAVDEKGEFSLVYRKNLPQKTEDKKGLKNWYLERRERKRLEREFVSYSANSMEDYCFFKNGTAELPYKCGVDYTLKSCMPKLNMRYVTNFSYLKERK